MPNIKWLPSRSVNRREEHEQFYNRIWPKDDPFWDHNQPGNLWNCKCDWQQTDEPPTDNNPTSRIQHKGLDGNPAKTGQIFSDNASYFKNSDKSRYEFNKECRRKILEFKRKSFFANSEIGKIEVTKSSYKEALQSSMNRDTYWTKLEILENLDKNIGLFSYTGTEDIDLNHNSKNSKAFKEKKKSSKFHVFKATIGSGDIILKVLEYKKDESLHAYTIT